MKTILATIIALGALGAFAATPDSLTTTDGRTFNHINSLRTDPDGLFIEYSLPGGGIGAATVKFTQLPGDVQKQYGYDPDAARKFEDANSKATADFRAWADQQETARAKAEADAAARDFQWDMIMARQQLAMQQQTPAAAPANTGYSAGYGYGGLGYPYPYGSRASVNAWTGSTYKGTVPIGQLFTPLGFSPNKLQATPATPRIHAGGESAHVELR